MCVLHTPCVLHVVNPSRSWRLTWSPAGRDRNGELARQEQCSAVLGRQTRVSWGRRLRCGARRAVGAFLPVAPEPAVSARALGSRPSRPSRAVSGPSPDGRAQPGSVCGRTHRVPSRGEGRRRLKCTNAQTTVGRQDIHGDRHGSAARIGGVLLPEDGRRA